MTTWPEVRVRKPIDGEGDPGKTDQFVLLEDCEYWHPLNGMTVIPAGFLTDGLSVPQAFWWLVPPHGIGFQAAVVHDHCYVVSLGAQQYGDRLARLVADVVFEHQCEQLGMPAWEVRLVYQVVRLGGYWNWQKYRKRNLLQ